MVRFVCCSLYYIDPNFQIAATFTACLFENISVYHSILASSIIFFQENPLYLIIHFNITVQDTKLLYESQIMCDLCRAPQGRAIDRMLETHSSIAAIKRTIILGANVTSFWSSLWPNRISTDNITHKVIVMDSNTINNHKKIDSNVPTFVLGCKTATKADLKDNCSGT